MDEQTAQRIADELNSMNAEPGMRVIVDYDGTVGDDLFVGDGSPPLSDDQVMMSKPWANERVTTEDVHAAFAEVKLRREINED